MCDMMAKDQIMKTGAKVAEPKTSRRLRAELEHAFVPELELRIGRNCNLGNIVVALMNKDYSGGSPFDGIFTHSKMVQRPQPCPITGSKFMEKETEKILHANILHNGRIDYGSLGCDHVEFHKLNSIDDIEYGAKVRQKLEYLMVRLTRLHGIRKGSSLIWSVQLLASSQRARQSLLVFRLSSENMPKCSVTDNSSAVFAIVPTSSRMELDAFAVADHMILKEGYPANQVLHLAKGKPN